MITSYNLKALGDVLVIILGPNADAQSVTTHGQVTRIQDKKDNRVQYYWCWSGIRLDRTGWADLFKRRPSDNSK